MPPPLSTKERDNYQPAPYIPVAEARGFTAQVGNLGGMVRQREVIIGPDRRLRLTLEVERGRLRSWAAQLE